MAVATVGGLNVAEAQSDSTTTHRTPDVGLQTVTIDQQLLRTRQAADDRELRASRERARRTLGEGKRKEDAQRKRTEAQRRQREMARLAKRVVPPVRHYRLTASFGQASGLWSSVHTGQDFAAPTGTPVYAAAQGVVTSAEWAGAYGWRVIIRHVDGTETWYCHLSSFAVRGGRVQAGQLIGWIGSTGNTTGPHLHFEVRRNGQPVNPVPWLRTHGAHV